MDEKPTVNQSEEICAIDFGSKNFKFVIGRQIGVDIEVDLLKKEPMLLGKELLDNNGTISEEKLSKIDTILQEFENFCKSQGIKTILGVGTSAIRSAKNGKQLAQLIQSHGISFEIAQGKREGEISYLSVTNGAANQLVSDMGSRSFQYAFKNSDKITSFSLKSGYQIAYEKHFFKASTFSEGRKEFRKVLTESIHKIPKNTDIYIALASNTMAAFVFGGSKLDVVNQFLRKKTLQKKINDLKKLGSKGFTVIKENTPKVDKILPGLVFIEYMLELSRHDKVMVAEVELPAGLIVEHLLNNRPHFTVWTQGLGGFKPPPTDLSRSTS